MTDPFGFDRLDLDWLRTKPGIKWQRTPGALAAWVADMDFPPAPVVVERLTQVIATGDLGYPNWRGFASGTPVREVFLARAASRYGWRIDDIHELRELCDVVQGIEMVLHLCTEPGDAVVVHTPAYPPFFRAIEAAGCRLVEVAMRRTERGWDAGIDELVRRLAHERARVLLLCNPQNPTGHVFGRAELEALAELAERHDLLILSDEIHADVVYAPNQHVPIASLGPEIATRTVTLHSASKAFNLAGLRYAIAHVGPTWVRERLGSVPQHVFGAMNLFAVEATRAAWTDGDEWLCSVVAHLDRNRSILAGLLDDLLPGVDHVPPAGTYLAWLDCRALDLGADPSDHFRRHGVDLSPGPDFGTPGAGHVRLNFATSASVLSSVVATMAASLRATP